MVPDVKPIIGRAPGLANVLIAAGHGMLGLSMAPATGKLVSEMLLGASPHVDPLPYSARRF
jgi:D-amino-acid dehydrogenase